MSKEKAQDFLEKKKAEAKAKKDEQKSKADAAKENLKGNPFGNTRRG
jgi:hypothetical protein